MSDPLLILGIVLIAGSAGGWVAERLRSPAITGNIVAGIALGYTVFKGIDVVGALQPLSTFAIGLIAVSAGGHFSYRRIHNSLKRILFIAFFEVAVAVTLVMIGLLAAGATWPVALLLSCLAAGTAPATTVALIRENRAKGPFVKTLLAVVSVNSSICILLFAFGQSLLAGYYASDAISFGLIEGVRQTAWQLTGSVSLAVLLGFISTRLFAHNRFHDFSTMIVTILLAVGLSIQFNCSPLLTCLLYGAYLGNSSQESERQLRTLDPIELLLYVCFFTLAGVSLHFDLLAQAGVLCLVYVAARAGGKAIGAILGAVLSGSSRRIITSIPLGLIPQAGVALGLVVVLQGDSRIAPEISSLVGTIVLAAVAINEIIGPFATRSALRRAKEAGLDRPRLVEFLQEEFIEVNMVASDKLDALTKLTNLYARTHRVNKADRDAILRTVTKREDQGTTAVGYGTAIPHGRVDSGHAIQGVLGIFPDGVEFEAPDGLPVQLIALIVTPVEHEQRHLEVLASLTSMISNERIRTRLIAAVDANDAWEVIESKESRSYNYFLESDGEENGGPAQA